MNSSLEKSLDLKYPGRGIIIGNNEKGNLVIAYFITGRSENSRNRIFTRNDDGLIIKPYDESKVTDPSLIIYRPFTTYNNNEIITNGDQTETVLEYLKNGKSFIDALNQRQYEPDAPNFTPRISALAHGDTISLSILRKDNNSDKCIRDYYSYKQESKVGYFIRTYIDDGNPLPSFDIPPIKLELEGNAKQLATIIWNALNADNKISLFVREIDKDGKVSEEIINKHK
ncbi:MAG: IMP cyclohydrolase [Clostridia bacterium]|nr:IMP cyclohydrolase [Clostridia bacterium]